MNQIAAASTRPGPRPWTGCVVGVEVGVLRVLTDRGEVRASYGARMLGRIARDRDVLPQAGEWVALRRWSDGRITVEDCWARRAPAEGSPDSPGATVIPLRRR